MTEETQKKSRLGKKVIIIIFVILAFYIFRTFINNDAIPWLQAYSANRLLDWALEPKYTAIYEFKDGIAYIENERGGSFFSSDGRILEDSLDKQEAYLKSTLCLTSKRSESGYEMRYGVNTLYGETILEPKYKEIQGISSEIIIANEAWNSPYEFFNQKGQRIMVLENEYDVISGFSEGLASFRKGGLYGYMDMEGEVVIQPQFTRARSFSEGYAAVAIDNEGGDSNPRWGFIDYDGNLLIECKYLDVGDFGEGLAAFSIETFDIEIPGQASPQVAKLYGYMDADENVVIEPQYFSSAQFSDGVAIAIPGFEAEPVSKHTNNPSYPVHIINSSNEVLLIMKVPATFVFENARDGYIKVQNKITGKMGLISNPSY